MRGYLFVANGDNEGKDSYTFDINTHYAKRLMKDVGLYEVCYVMYCCDTKKVTGFGHISCIEYYEKEKKAKVLFEKGKQMDKPFDLGITYHNNIIPLEAKDFERIGISTMK